MFGSACMRSEFQYTRTQAGVTRTAGKHDEEDHRTAPHVSSGAPVALAAINLFDVEHLPNSDKPALAFHMTHYGHTQVLMHDFTLGHVQNTKTSDPMPYLGCAVGLRSHSTVQHRGGGVHMSSETEVHNFEVEIAVQHQILGLEVAMNHTLRVQVIHTYKHERV